MRLIYDPKTSVNFEIAEDVYEQYDVVFFPNSGRYYPRHKGKYLWESPATGNYEQSNSPILSEFARTERDAWTIIDRDIINDRRPPIVTKKHPLCR